jgi:hypothetical protein
LITLSPIFSRHFAMPPYAAADAIIFTISFLRLFRAIISPFSFSPLIIITVLFSFHDLRRHAMLLTRHTPPFRPPVFAAISPMPRHLLPLIIIIAIIDIISFADAAAMPLHAILMPLSLTLR